MATIAGVSFYPQITVAKESDCECNEKCSIGKEEGSVKERAKVYGIFNTTFK